MTLKPCWYEIILYDAKMSTASEIVSQGRLCALKRIMLLMHVYVLICTISSLHTCIGSKNVNAVKCIFRELGFQKYSTYPHLLGWAGGCNAITYKLTGNLNRHLYGHL